MLVVFYGYFRNSVIAPEDKTLKCSILLWNSPYTHIDYTNTPCPLSSFSRHLHFFKTPAIGLRNRSIDRTTKMQEICSSTRERVPAGRGVQSPGSWRSQWAAYCQVWETRGIWPCGSMGRSHGVGFLRGGGCTRPPPIAPMGRFRHAQACPWAARYTTREDQCGIYAMLCV